MQRLRVTGLDTEGAELNFHVCLSLMRAPSASISVFVSVLAISSFNSSFMFCACSQLRPPHFPINSQHVHVFYKNLSETYLGLLFILCSLDCVSAAACFLGVSFITLRQKINEKTQRKARACVSPMEIERVEGDCH